MPDVHSHDFPRDHNAPRALRYVCTLCRKSEVCIGLEDIPDPPVCLDCHVSALARLVAGEKARATLDRLYALARPSDGVVAPSLAPGGSEGGNDDGDGPTGQGGPGSRINGKAFVPLAVAVQSATLTLAERALLADHYRRQMGWPLESHS